MHRTLLQFLLLLSITACPGPAGYGQEKISKADQGKATGISTSPDHVDQQNSTQRKAKYKFEKHGAIVYRKFDDFELKCDLYIPEGKGPFPAIIAIHGGAWRSGTKFVMLRHAWKLAEAGYVVVAINYRHAPEHRFPAQVHDCKYAVRWIKANAQKYHVDPARIGGFGYSAGGHLVSMLGVTDKDVDLEGEVPAELEEFDSRIKAVAAGGAPCEFSWLSKSSRVLAYWLGGARSNKPEVYELASPLTHVTADDPPFFLFHGDGDMIVPKASSLKFHEALKQSGVTTEHHLAEQYGHLGTFSDLRWMDKIIPFFDKHLKEPEN